MGDNGEKRQMSIIQGISKKKMTKAELPSAEEMIEHKLEKVYEENRPRDFSINEYFNLINLDAVAAVKRVNQIKKLYSN